MVAAFVAAMLYPAPAFADHRPGNVVVMGGTLGLTGRFAGPAKRDHNARKLFVDELNARGGLLGHKVELKIYDDKSDRRTAIELYEKLITEDKVDIIIGPYSSHLTDPVANVMERYKQPFVSTGGAHTIYQRGRKYVFSIPLPAGTSRDRQKGTVHLAKKIGAKRVAVIALTERITQEAFLGAQEWAKKLGLKVVLSERYPPGQMDFKALLQRIKASGAEAIIAASRLRDTVALIRQLRELNINVKMLAGTIGPASPKFVKELGNLAEYVVGRAGWLPTPALGHPGLKEFVDNYEKQHGEKPNYHAAVGYTVMQLTAAAVRIAGSFDPEKVREALASMRVYTIYGPYKANEQGLSNTIDHLHFQIQNGKRVIVWPAQMSEARFLPMPKWEDRGKK